MLIFGLVLNTTFLIREIRRNEQHDAFINAVTHELKTPIASIRLYLETLKHATSMKKSAASFTTSCSPTAIGCLRRSSRCCAPDEPDIKRRRIANSVINVGEMVRECLELTRVRHGLNESRIDVQRVSRSKYRKGLRRI